MPERYLGRTLGRFRIDSVVGAGGFAWVYQGYDPELDIPVAVKVLKPQFAGDEAFESRFRREASLAARLRHPNIVRILAVGRDADAVYFAMDFLPHGLVDRLRVMKMLPESLLVRVGLDVTKALGFAHREGVIHRDIKPDNILFDDHGNAVVADFGIARAASGYAEQTGTNVVVGTPHYFSPEQARGRPVDGRSDVYSLGVTLYRAATGTLPFEGADWYEIARRHVEEPPPRPQRLNPALSNEMEAIILRCLAKEPAERFQSADDLHEAFTLLHPALGDPSTSRTLEVYRTPDSGRAIRFAPRRSSWAPARPRTRALVVAAMLGTAAAAATGALALVRRATRLDRPGDRRLAAVETARALAPAPPDSSGVAVPAPSGSVAAESLPARPPAPRTAVLRVHAPANARLSVNGTPVGRGDWASDTLPPAAYSVTAVIDAIDGCETAKQTQRVALIAGGARDLSLAVRPCGYLAIDARPVGATYSVRSESDGWERRGVLGEHTRLVLPAGTYRLRVSAPGCDPYESDRIRIEPGSTVPKRARLLREGAAAPCDEGPRDAALP